MSGAAVVVAFVGAGAVLPEGNTGRGVRMIPYLTHDFDLVGCPGIRCTITTETRSRGRWCVGR